MTLPIEYTEVLTLVLVIFGIVGMMRGWYREGVTALFVALLAILVWRTYGAVGRGMHHRLFISTYETAACSTRKSDTTRTVRNDSFSGIRAEGGIRLVVDVTRYSIGTTR